jgi:hypothetical protein
MGKKLGIVSVSIPVATDCYNVDHATVIARGVSYTDKQLDSLIAGPVKEILRDTAGKFELDSLLASIATTDFEQQGVKELLGDSVSQEDWLVGEALAEAYVVYEGKCTFPWPSSRDLKNPAGSPPGADLTGFQELDCAELPYRFAFGEVKTSDEEKWPPQVMYGRSTGLKKQLEDLRNSRPTKHALVRYLGFHALNASWFDMFKSAVKRYLQSGTEDIAIFGVMVRDVEPKELDLAHRAVAMADDCPATTSIRLYALYLPLKSIKTLASKVLAAVGTGGTA